MRDRNKGLRGASVSGGFERYTPPEVRKQVGLGNVVCALRLGENARQEELEKSVSGVCAPLQHGGVQGELCSPLFFTDACLTIGGCFLFVL